jgi:hypothetical protein
MAPSLIWAIHFKDLTVHMTKVLREKSKHTHMNPPLDQTPPLVVVKGTVKIAMCPWTNMHIYFYRV